MGCSQAKDTSPRAKQVAPTTVEVSQPKVDIKLEDGEKLVLNRYRMQQTKAGTLGEGSFCICYRAIDSKTDKQVAIKVYKVNKAGPKEVKALLLKFKRQIEVLKELMTPLEKKKVPEPGLWSEALEKIHPEDVFIQLLDYSKDDSGEPGNDPKDGLSYVVTELADYSMKDYLADARERGHGLDKSKVKSMTKATIKVIASLHAKGLVHLDIKPENLMYMGGHWKLIDVDGCVKIGQKVQISDASISFSPVYCAPEWARFLIEDQSTIKISAMLDVWSVGITIAEIVFLNAILKDKYVSFLKKAASHREAGFFFMDWLSNLESVPLQKEIEDFDPALITLIRKRLCVPDVKARANLCACLDDPFLVVEDAQVSQVKSEKAPKHHIQLRAHADDSAPPGLCDGVLWRLNVDPDRSVNEDMKNPNLWVKRTMWLAKNGNLCYQRPQENKRIVYMDRAKLVRCKIRLLSASDGAAKPNAFELSVTDEDNGNFESIYLATETEAERKKWATALENVVDGNREWMEPKTMVCDENFVKELRAMRLRNRRKTLTNAGTVSIDQFEPTFKHFLWKLKQDGDEMREDNWFRREMWLAKNGSLCYWSKKEEKNLIYYNHSDLVNAVFSKLPPTKTSQQFAFEVIMQPVDGVDFEPGLFAADTDADRDLWIKEFERVADEQNSAEFLS